MRLQLKFFLCFIAAAPFVFALFIFYSIQSNYESNEALVQSKANLIVRSTANSLVLPIWEINKTAVDRILHFFDSDPDFVQAVVYDQNGKELYSFRKNIPDANDVTVSQSITYEPSGELLGNLKVTFSLNSLEVIYHSIIWQGIWEFLVLCLCDYIIISINLKQLVFKPLQQLYEVTKEFSAGNLSARVMINTKDEFANIGFAFNHMATSIENYQRHLKELVAIKTAELELRLQELTKMQQQVIVQEKMASLGALTAGIAHEIKNPLNFVNSFAQLSDELLSELETHLAPHISQFPKASQTDILECTAALAKNLKWIYDNGKRADSIVQRMLGHARSTPGFFAMTDLNELIVEYANLSYHGMRAAEPLFNVTIEKHLSPGALVVNLIAEDFSRVLLNIFNNAFYAIYEKQKLLKGGYSPMLEISTKKIAGGVEVRIKDNGIGIPKDAQGKIFTPFFTTKPTGQGTGLGLSLSHAIVTQEHGGTLEFKSQEGEYTEFILKIPTTAQEKKSP
jgi:signal transduction histidine kinase